ncbi:MAG: phosphoribosylaminoimidazolesuccinocarboxamide synthase [Bifidobacterium scardovii]
MEKLEKLYEGKAKQLYATDDPEVLWVEYKNTATAGDGEKKEDFTGKGRLNNLITTIIFDLLKKRGIDSHLIKRVDDTGQLVQQGEHVPVGDRRCATWPPATSAPVWAWRKACRSRSRYLSTS